MVQSGQIFINLSPAHNQAALNGSTWRQNDFETQDTSVFFSPFPNFSYCLSILIHINLINADRDQNQN